VGCESQQNQWCGFAIKHDILPCKTASEFLVQSSIPCSIRSRHFLIPDVSGQPVLHSYMTTASETVVPWWTKKQDGVWTQSDVALGTPHFCPNTQETMHSAPRLEFKNNATPA
jgi:hypothetical protein